MNPHLLYELIKAHDTITIFAHVFPDGDSVGSQIGLKEAIKSTFPTKQVFAVGSGLPRFFDLLGGMDQVSDEVIRNSLALVVDVANAPRVEDQRFLLAPTIFKIDHHIPATQFGMYQWIDTSALAVSMMIASFVKEHDFSLSPRGASALALGMVSDSGRFLFGELTGELFHLVALMINLGAKLPEIYRLLYEKTIDQVEVERHIYQNYKTTDAGMIYCHMKQGDLARLGISADQAGAYVNQLGKIKGFHVWAMFSEEEGIARCELRSDGLDVQAIAAMFGGGGHKQAAGCVIPSSQIQAIIAATDRRLRSDSQHVGN